MGVRDKIVLLTLSSCFFLTLFTHGVAGHSPMLSVDTSMCSTPVKGIVHLLPVRKGLNNQRLRFVQDIVVASLLGMAVEFEENVYSRVGCQNNLDCYKNYRRVPMMWETYDKEHLLSGLEAAGVCVTSTSSNSSSIPMLGMKRPIPASEVEKMAESSYILRRVPYKYVLGSKGGCCFRILLNTDKSRELFRLVNEAFKSSSRIVQIATLIRRKYREIVGESLGIALHWRGDSDFTSSTHTLSLPGYLRQVKEALRRADDSSKLTRNMRENRFQRDGPTQVFVLGDVSRERLEALELMLNEDSLPELSVDVKLYSKNSLLPEMNFDALFNFADDVKGQIDYRLGLEAHTFIGSPFSSFSALIRYQRQHRSIAKRRHTFSVENADTSDNLGELFSVLLPSPDSNSTNSMCSRMAHWGPVFKAALAVCSERELLLNRLERKRRREERLTVVLHPILSGGECPLLQLHMMDQEQSQKRYDILADHLARENKELIVGSSVQGAWDCRNAADAIRNYGTFFNENIFYVLDVLEGQPSVLPQTPEERAIGCRGYLDAPVVDNRNLCSHLAPEFVFDPPLDDPSRHNGLGCDLVVVTSLFGSTRDTLHIIYQENLRAFEAKYGLHSCWFAFVDAASLRRLENQGKLVSQKNSDLMSFSAWSIVYVSPEMMPSSSTTSVLASRLPKMLGHRAFATAAYMLYLDAKLSIDEGVDVWRLVLHNVEKPAAWYSPRHSKRTSPYAEARCVHILGLASDEVVYQMRQYYQEGLPYTSSEDWGKLIEGEWHLRNLHDSRSSEIGCKWYEEFEKWGQPRDQVSFNYVLWWLEQKHTNIAGSGLGPPLFRFGQSADCKFSRAPHHSHNSQSCALNRGENEEKVVMNYLLNKAGKEHQRADG